MTDAIKNLELWIYTGARVSGDGERLTSWRDQEGATLLYPEESIGYEIGRTYNVKVERTGNQVLRGTPSVQGFYPGVDEVSAWITLDHVAEIRLARLKRKALDESEEPPDWPPIGS